MTSQLHYLHKFIYFFCVLLFSVFTHYQGVAATYYSRVDGDWSIPSTWSLTQTSQVAAASVPGIGDNVIILNGRTITVTGNTSVGSLAINSGGVLNIGALPAISGRLRLANNVTMEGRLLIRKGSTLDGTGRSMSVNAGVNGNPVCNQGNANVEVDGVLLLDDLSIEASCLYVSGVPSISAATPPGFVRIQRNLTITQRGDMQIAGLYLVGGNVKADQGNIDITGTGYFGVAGTTDYQNNGGPDPSLNYCQNSSVLSCSPAASCPFPSTQNTTNECNNVCRAFVCSGFASSFPLPINLISFSATKELNPASVRLEWTTASERNNDYFVVERSRNAIEFEALEKVKGAGNRDLVRTYAANDRNPLPGIAYYRLKQIDLDGKFSYSKVISIEMEVTGFTISPNPADGKKFSVSWSSPAGKAEIYIYDQAGRELYMAEIDNNLYYTEKTIYLKETLKKGIYLVKVQIHGRQFTQKLMVNN
jgi:hypothetical protein